MLLDAGTVEEDAALKTSTGSDLAVGANDDVGANRGGRVDGSGRVDEDVTGGDGGVLRGVGELSRLLRREVGEVEAGSREVVYEGREGKLLGREKGRERERKGRRKRRTLGLSNVHPVALEVHRVKLAVLGHGGEDVGLDRSRLDLDAVEDGRVEDVDTGVDAVSDELLRLLDEAVDRRLARDGKDDTVLGRLVNLGNHQSTLTTVSNVEVAELAEGVRAGDIRVEDEEGSVVLAEDLAGESKGTSWREKRK